ncbi:photosystem ii cp47 reaction center protein [Phtheirospermum japonicum]|uniref:Photosystem ii cp47 reaction center protein n=1 Tax=Phtheirospermum japonicum TaxID=374723 RepID=A0A830BUK6_9LAMI|nr:photosystem ii cp47 reaction center protein [Phtheirospermum japonicum]
MHAALVAGWAGSMSLYELAVFILLTLLLIQCGERSFNDFWTQVTFSSSTLSWKNCD